MERRGRLDAKNNAGNANMNCAECEVLLHALIDGELDAGHARDVEAHAAHCPACAEKLQAFRAMREAIAEADLKEFAPANLRSRIEAALPLPASSLSAPSVIAPRQFFQPSRRTFFGGFAVGTAVSAALAASLVLTVVRNDEQQTIADEVVSAHIRSLQPGHLMDVETSDQHTVKPWFNGKLDVAPPVIDLTAEGFTLLGGRLDYIDGEPVASVVYRRRKHVINLFVAQRLGAKDAGTKIRTVQGYNVRHWSEQGLDFWAVSDLAADELAEFVQKISAALHPSRPS
jgi:anti-sigma factor RsiW